MCLWNMEGEQHFIESQLTEAPQFAEHKLPDTAACQYTSARTQTRADSLEGRC